MRPGFRVGLRRLEEGDAEALHGAIGASRASLKRRLRWVASVSALEDCREFIRRSGCAAHRQEELVYGIFEPRGGLVGVAALQNLLKTPGVAELSCWIRAESRGKGCASGAGRLLIELAFRRDGLRRLYARLEPSNRPARKVIQKLGFFYEGRLRQEKRLNGRWVDQECWGLLRSEWKKRGS